jgi:hypothetical protein
MLLASNFQHFSKANTKIGIETIADRGPHIGVFFFEKTH